MRETAALVRQEPLHGDGAPRGGLWLGLAVAAFWAARWANDFFERLTWSYYGFAGVAGGVPEPSGAIPRLGGCELFLYHGGQAVARALDFLTLYFGAVLLALAIVSQVEATRRKQVLLGLSVLFLLVAVPVGTAVRLGVIVAALFAVARLPLPAGSRAACFALSGLVLLGTVGRDAVAAASATRFALWGLAYPYLFVALALFLKTFRRLCWVTHDLQCGGLSRPDPVDFALLFVGLPFLVGNGVAASYTHFRDSYGRSGAFAEGARTVGQCAVAALLMVVVARIGYFPVAPVFFEHCSLWTASPSALWSGFALTYVADYLFLLATEQTSVGVARLFGFAMHDNYRAPLLATSPAEFWRRWNIYWRDFHLVALFYPITLALGRRAGRQRGWHMGLAAMATFTATWFLNVVPYWMYSRGVETMLPWRDVAPALAVYFGGQGLAVAATLMWEARGRRRPPVRLAWLGAVVLTFAFVALLRFYVEPDWAFAEKTIMVQRALGLLGTAR